MSHTFYYKSTNPAVVAALRKNFSERTAIQLEQNKFARRFGGVAMHSAMDQRLLGVAFINGKKPKDEALWTRADRHGMRHPKRLGGGAAGDKLRAAWKKHWPNASIPENGFLAELNLPQFQPGRSMGYALKGSAAYLCISHPVTDKRLKEIRASDYTSAVKEKD